MLWSISTTTVDQTSNGIAFAKLKILDVVRESGVDGEYVPCKEMHMRFESKVQNPSSPFYATKQNPVFIRKDGKIYVYPAPINNGADTFKFTSVVYPSASEVPHGGSGISGFPDDLEYIVIYGAAVRCAIHLMSNIDVEIKDAMSNVKLLFDTQLDDVSGGGGTAESILFWLNDEDPEMVQATSAGAQAELARVQSLLTEKQTIQQTIQNLSGAYKAAISAAGIAKYSQEQQAPQGQ